MMPFLLVAKKCDDNSSKTSGKNFSDYLKIEQKLYPTPYVNEYVITKDSLKSSLVNSKSDKDSLLFSVKIDTLALGRLTKKFTALKDTVYANNCVSDGQVFGVDYFIDQSSKKLRFSNVYNKALDSTIVFLNKNLKKKIEYNKKLLESLKNNCN